MTDPRVLSGLSTQFETLHERLLAGERALGWKVGLNAPAIQQALGIDETVIGYLTGAGLLEDGGRHSLAGATAVAVEAELAIHLSADVGGRPDAQEAAAAIGGYGVAIEIVDIDLPFEDVEAIVAQNVFQRGVLLGEPAAERPDATALRVSRNGSLEHELDATQALGEAAATVAHVAALAGEAGEQLSAGEVIISGSLAPLVFVEPGHRVSVELEPLGALQVDFEA